MNLLRIKMLEQRLLETVPLFDKRDDKAKKTTKTINKLVANHLPILKDINPTIEEIEYFFTNVVSLQNNGHEFDYIIL